MLQGKKTYLVITLAVIYAILGFVLGYHDFQVMAQIILASGAGAGVRDAIAKLQSSVKK